VNSEGETIYSEWVPYEFKWIDYIGAMMINNIAIHCNGIKLQEISGTYLLTSVLRDFDYSKRELFFEMIGHTPEMVDPANSNSHTNMYPNAFYTDDTAGCEPSIYGRRLYIPIHTWFTHKTQHALPLICSRYGIFEIKITFRPICEMFRIRDVQDYANNYPYIAPNFNEYYMQFYRFIQQPPDVELGINSYTDKRMNWNANIHLNCTYIFLDKAEQNLFITKPQSYVIKQAFHKEFYNTTGSNRINIESTGLITSWMFFFRRSDVRLRNEWTNFTNYPYNYRPLQSLIADCSGSYSNPNTLSSLKNIGAGINPDGSFTGLLTTPIYNPMNTKNILLSLGILLDGDYRENVIDEGVYNYVEKYNRCSGFAPSGLYTYQCCLDTSPYQLQPTGAMDVSNVKTIQFEYNTILPPLDPYAQSMTICDPITGEVIGINKPTWRIYQYNYDCIVLEERLNVVQFSGGYAELLYPM
jgi:hypothetical protein